MLEVGRAQRSIFLARWLRDRDLQRETESGLNVVENYNGVNDYIRFGKRGELASNPVREEDAAQLSPFVRKHLGVHGTYSFALPDLEPGAIRELRDPDAPDDDEE